jgi:hypothetical protein
MELQLAAPVRPLCSIERTMLAAPKTRLSEQIHTQWISHAGKRESISDNLSHTSSPWMMETRARRNLQAQVGLEVVKSIENNTCK